MSKEVAVLATVAAGGFVALQAPLNNVLSQKVGTFGAATVNFTIGTLCLLVITVLLVGGFTGVDDAGSPPWWYWVLGGVAGAVYVTTALVMVREVGAGGVTAATIAGQLAVSVVIDRLGVLGLDERAVTWEKLLGVSLLAAGTWMIVRE